jgi:SAM-dependent methyltransferase
VSHTDDELDAFAEWERAAWESRAAPYAEGFVDLTGRAAPALLDAAGVTAGARVLDVATGSGVVAQAARERGAEVVAVDQAEAMVAIARSAGVDARLAAVERLPFDDGEFDAVVAGFLLNHLARPLEGVSEMARVARGRVAVSVWDLPAANPALGLFGPVLESMGLPGLPSGPDSHLFADDARLAALLADGGLGDVTVSRATWSVTVEPGSWFDAVAAGTPRTGGMLAAARPQQRAELRARYVEVARRRFGSTGGLVTLPAAAVVGSGRSD